MKLMLTDMKGTMVSVPLADRTCEECGDAVTELATLLKDENVREIRLCIVPDRNASGTLMGFHLSIEKEVKS